MEVADLAERQHGLVTRAQVRALGGTDKMIAGRCGNGRWEPLGDQVLRLRGGSRSWRQELLAAVLDAGPRAVATGRAAGALWQIPGFSMKRPEVLVKRPSDHRPSLGALHETRSLPDHHRSTVDGIPVVTVARLLVELAATESARRLERAVDNACAAGIVSPGALASAVAELCVRGRKGSATIRSLSDGIGSTGYVPPASELEARFRDLVRHAGLPEPVRQVDAGGERWIGRVDVLFPEARLVVELDGRRWHDTRLAIESDRRRDNELVAAGWRVVRVTWRALVDDPAAVVQLVRRLMAGTVAA
jgi:G:T-mismatch repair DNA endonuclease (very short patch repair protein)